MRKYTLQNVVERVGDVYSIPEAALRARKMLSDPNVEVDGLARVIGLDQGLASKVMRIANSSFYGRLHPSDTVRDAIVTIGLRNMQNVITAHVARDFNASFGTPEHAVWEHSLAVSVIAMALAEKTKVVSVEDDPDGYLGLGRLRLRDGTEIVARNVLRAEWLQYVGKPIVVTSRVAQVEDGEGVAFELVGWRRVCEGTAPH